MEYIEEPLVKGLEDNNSYVRRTAVMGCIKLFHLTPDIVDGTTLIISFKIDYLFNTRNSFSSISAHSFPTASLLPVLLVESLLIDISF